MAQECIHSIKKKKMKPIILKMDLVKAFDRVDWTFLRFVLLQSGIPYEATNWILGCVSSANFSVLVNGHSTEFFKGDRGLWQGYPLSPLLFLMVIEGFSLLLKLAKVDKHFFGIQLSPGLSITHLLFVDDVLVFGRGSVQDWKYFSDILKLFCTASGMQIGPHKSTLFISADLEPDLLFKQ